MIISFFMKTKAELIRQIKEFDKISSKSGRASYSNFKVNGDLVHFIRDNTKQRWSLDIDVVYNVYRKEKRINTVVLKRYFSGRVYSPSLTILIASGFCDEQGNRIV
jgi:hypothetical protein